MNLTLRGLIFVLLAAGGAAAGAAEATGPGAAPPAAVRPDSDLDRQLLDGLEPPPGAKPPPPAAPSGPAAKPVEPPAADLEDGEDLGAPAADPLVAISRRMQRVGERMQQHDTGEATQRLQQRIVADLDQLLEQLNKQCSGGQCQQPAASKAGSKPGTGKKAGTGENTGTNQPAQESTERRDATATDAAAAEALQRELKAIWGHLPPKLREQLQSGLFEQFLPQYEQLIEAYYKRLAEESASR